MRAESERRESSVTLSRRGLIGGLIGIIAAPAIVRAASLMPVKSFRPQHCRDWVSILRDQNVLLRIDEYAGLPQMHWRGIPIRVVDRLPAISLMSPHGSVWLDNALL